jgi:hypothetical protein
VKITKKQVTVPEQVVPEYSWDDVEFSCEKCDFVTQDEEDYKKKHGGAHSFTDAKEIDGYKWYYFRQESEHSEFLAYLENFHSASGYGQWKGPGWYNPRLGMEPCGRGCCTKDTVTFVWLDDELERLTDLKESTEETITSLTGNLTRPKI